MTAGNIFFIIVGAIIYFLPSVIGWKKKKSDAILLLNILLGWTLIGWVVALVWALAADPEQQQQSK
jgi:hypothetical protein